MSFRGRGGGGGGFRGGRGGGGGGGFRGGRGGGGGGGFRGGRGGGGGRFQVRNRELSSSWLINVGRTAL